MYYPGEVLFVIRFENLMTSPRTKQSGQRDGERTLQHQLEPANWDWQLHSID